MHTPGGGGGAGSCSGVRGGGEEKKAKILSHIHTLYLQENQAAGKAAEEEHEEAEEVARVDVSFTRLAPVSLAADREVSGQRSPAPTRWLPGFQSPAPAHL